MAAIIFELLYINSFVFAFLFRLICNYPEKSNNQNYESHVNELKN